MSIDLTGIQNVGEFYSHHYLDALLEDDLRGLFAGWRTAEEKAPDQRLNRCATAYFAAKSRAMQSRRPAERYQASHGLHVALLEALGYPYTPDVRYLLTDEVVPILSAVPRDGHEYLWAVETTFADPDTSPLEQTILLEQLAGVSSQDAHRAGVRSQTSGGKSQIGSPKSEIADLQTPWEDLIGEIFRRDEPPRWLILFAGQKIYLLDRTKWGYGQYLLFDLDELFARREREALRATAALLARDALAPDDGIPLHDTLDENSHKHAHGVSQDLKFGVRRAVELLANEWVWYTRNVAHQSVLSTGDLARRLTDDALRYLYRLLFLFYAEARAGELGIVPMRSEAYRGGYSLEMLRDLEQVPLTTPQAQDGYFIHESLTKLFGLVNDGYRPPQLALREENGNDLPLMEDGFTLDGLHSELFDATSTPLLSKARFRNRVLQEVIQLLSLSRETGGRRQTRGRISYAQLGINQLGAVYEGLLSYSGFFAQERLYEVKPADKKEDADETQQTYFVPERDLSRYEPAEFVYQEMPDGTRQRKAYERGAFIFRLAGRDREKSASYYTPEVLTQCVVKYSLRELLEGKTADEILRILLCEMALGSGAFGNEGLNQLADAYLERKQAELGRRIPADEYQRERQRVKAYLAVHNFYGVDLNPTAVELARVSLWLNVIYEGAEVPWFGPRLAVGNSLIGARRQVYSADDVKSGAYREKPPTPAPVGQPRPAGSVYHWLLPDAGMVAFDGDKVIAELAPDAVKAIKAWRKGFTAKITADELKILQALSDRADELWAAHLAERRRILEATRQEIPVWGQPETRDQESGIRRQGALTIADRERIFASLSRPTSPYRRLKLALDYWCSLWFWPIPEASKLPSRSEFLNEMAEIFAGSGEEPDFDRPAIQFDLFPEAAPPRQTSFGELRPVSADMLKDAFPRLRLADEIAAAQRFHHWELAFPEVFADNGGFDLTVGNPPWVKLGWNEGGLLSDYDPLLALRKMSASDIAAQRQEQLTGPDRVREYLDEFAEMIGGMSYLNAMQNYPLLKGMQTNLYKCFITRAWEIGSRGGIAGFLHPEGTYDDPKGGEFRRHAYLRLRVHFQFHNELQLFAEVDHHTKYSVNVYATSPRAAIAFDHIVNLFHPSTVDRCYAHDGAGVVPGIRDDDDCWEVRGHRNRVIKVETETLQLFASLYDEPGTPPEQARLPSAHSSEIVSVLRRLDSQPTRLANLKHRYLATRMWDETGAQQDGTIRRETRFPQEIHEWIVSGPHFHVATPFNKTPNEGCKHNLDYSDIDLAAIPDDYLPRTNYVPGCSDDDYLTRIPLWNDRPVTDYYRQFLRAMLAITGERSLIGCLYPPGVSHINGAQSLVFDDYRLLVSFSALCSSILFDFFIRSTGRQNLHDLPALLPIAELKPAIRLLLYSRTLRLNCLTIHYADLWQELYDPAFARDGWAKADPRLRPWGDLTPQWQRGVALRTPFERRQALVEIDVLAAMALDLTLDELLTIYRVQFPVLQKNERRLRFDQRGMEVPMKTIGGELVVDESNPKVAEMVPPFTPVDREGDYREAWGWFAPVAG